MVINISVTVHNGIPYRALAVAAVSLAVSET